MDYVIIGNSAAAVGCIEGIRKIDKKTPITVITNENYHTYSRPLISYYLAGKINEQNMLYRPADFYKSMNCKLLTGTEVQKISPEKKHILLNDGSSLPYSKLLIATGSIPFVPPIKGIENVKKKFSFMSLDDAKSIEETITHQTRVLIMGAGLIGLKCAEGLAKRVAQITVVDLADRVLPSILDYDAAEIVKKHIEKENIGFVLSDSVQEFQDNKAILTSGKIIDFDVLIIAVGVRPNTKIFSDAGGKVGRGITTDEHCQTSLQDVYAAGDCTESFDITLNQNRVLALLPNAYMQGECAGTNMAGGEKTFSGAIPMNAIGFFGMHILTAGSYLGTEYTETGKDKYKKLFTDDGLLKGFILVGDVARAGIYTELIRNKIPLETIDFELIIEKPQLMAFSKAERAKMLGGKKYEN